MDQFFSNALQALPHVAASPLAMFAYIISIGAYVVVALRVRRHKNLLEHLTALPEKDRLKALETELGATKFRAGISAEQWLRSRIHYYYYMAFLATCITIIIIVSLVLYRTGGSVEIDVTGYHGKVNTDKTINNYLGLIPIANASGFEFEDPSVQDSSRKKSYSIDYSYEKKKDWLYIRPKSALLEKLLNEEEIVAYEKVEIFSIPTFVSKVDWPADRWQYPVLSVKVNNTTDKTLFLSEASIEVLSSDINMRPLVVVDLSSAHGMFGFSNEGWGKVLSPELSVTINDTTCEQDSDSIRENIPMEPFLETKFIDLSPYVSKQLRRRVITCENDKVAFLCLGNNTYCLELKENSYRLCSDDDCNERFGKLQCVEPFDGYETCQSVNYPFSFNEIKKWNPGISESDYQSVTYHRLCHKEPLCVKGVLTYAGEDKQVYKHNFRTLVSLGGPNIGAAAPPSYTYEVFLQAGKSGYVATRDLYQEIKPGEVDHFLLRLATDKTSNFKLKLKIKDTKSKVRWSGKIDMEVFIPQSVARQLTQRQR